MGFRNKLKNMFDNKKEDAPQSFSPETDKDNPTGRLSGNETSDEAGSAELSNTLCFRYLYNLIKMGRTNIVLHKDIVLRDDEPAEPFHITEDMVIDGNGHSIDARGKTGIFHITKGDFTLKTSLSKTGLAKTGEQYFMTATASLQSPTVNCPAMRHQIPEGQYLHTTGVRTSPEQYSPTMFQGVRAVLAEGLRYLRKAM